MQILFFVVSVLLGIFVGTKFFQSRVAKGHRKVTSGFWSFAAGFIVMCSSSILFEFVPFGQSRQQVSTLPPFDPNRALPVSLIGDGSTDEDTPVDEVTTKVPTLQK